MIMSIFFNPNSAKNENGEETAIHKKKKIVMPEKKK